MISRWSKAPRRQLVDKETEVASIHGEPVQEQTEKAPLKIVLADKVIELASLKKMLVDKQTEVASFKKDAEDKQTEVASFSVQRELMDRVVEIASLKEELVHEQTEKASVQRELMDRETEVALVKKELVHEQTEKASVQKELMDRETEVALLKKQLVHEQNEKASLKRELMEKDAQIKELKHHLDLLASHRRTDDDETWQFRGDSGEWVSFLDRANKELMEEYRKGHQICQIDIDGKTYKVNFKELTQENQRTRKKRQIRCFFNLPSHWNITDEEALTKFKPGNVHFETATEKVTDTERSRLEMFLNGSVLRHDGTQCACLHGSSKFVVIEAYQVRNLPLWRRYQRFVHYICDKERHHGICLDSGNEKLLLHGTRDFEVAKTIAMEGFDNRTARDSGLYGKGTYFATQTCKSAQYATREGKKSKASAQLVGTMLVARVAIGDPYFTPGPCHTLSRPPEKNGVRADSIIAQVGIPNGLFSKQSHMEVVTFAPEQAYPEYIVRFIEE